jgi:FKBP-type peptidyl-prolyl cis-trans isomerase 2
MQKGDFVRIDFVGKVTATGEIFDLTIEEIAKKEGIYNEKQHYGPALVIMGASMVVPGVEKKLEQMQPGGEKEFVLGPEEAFGRRDPKLIKIISKGMFTNQKINPVPGIFVTINGKQAKVQNVTGGRIRVDFNHPLAGKELSYRVKIVEQIKGTLDKAKAMIEYYGIKAEAKHEGQKLDISTVKPLPDVVKKIMEDKMKEWIKEIKEIKFFSKEKEKKPKAEEGKPTGEISTTNNEKGRQEAQAEPATEKPAEGANAEQPASG